jgi:hypothetical protein
MHDKVLILQVSELLKFRHSAEFYSGCFSSANRKQRGTSEVEINSRELHT